MPSAKAGDSVKSPSKAPATYEKITVGEPEMRGGTFRSYHVYKIQTVPSSGVDHVFRRFRDFVWLRAILVKSFPGLFVPPLPPKKYMGNTEKEFVVERRQDIERFLNRCAQLPALALSDPYTAFVSRAQTFDDAMKELDKQVNERPIDDMLRNYRQLFPLQMASQLPDKHEELLKQLTVFVADAEHKMTALLETGINLDRTVQAYQSHLGKLNTLTNQLETLEKTYPQRPEPPRLDVMENFTQWLESTKQIAPAYNQHLVQTFKYELADITALIELLRNRADGMALAHKAVARAARWKAPDAIANTDKLLKQKEADLKSEEHLLAFVDAQTRLLLATEFHKWWAEKTLNYKKAMAGFARHQLQVTQSLVQTWETLSEEANA